MEVTQREIDKLVSLAMRDGVGLDCDAIRWFVAEQTDRNPERDDAFLDLVSDRVWFGILAAS